MSFPEFTPGKHKVLFFSRGRGRGHATPDAEIATALEQLHANIEVRLVSYATGAKTLADLNISCIDLELPETAPLVEMTVLAGKLIQWLRPDLVVSHEEFAAAPAAKIFNVPVIFFTDWFTDPDMYSMGALRLADEIFFLGQSEIFAEPPWVKDRVRYLGPLRRAFAYCRADKDRARIELDLAPESTVVAVFPGSWPEATTPILDRVLAAWHALPAPKNIIWVAGADYRIVSDRLSKHRGAMVVESTTQIDQLMVAADVAITKTNRKTVLELALLGVPAIAVSFGLNPPDERVVQSIGSVRKLPPDALDAAVLAEMLHRPVQPVAFETCTAADCARLIAQHAGFN